MSLARFLCCLLGAFAAPLLAATGAAPLTPTNNSVAGGESQVFSARFTDGFGQPAVGEAVAFSNDACGTFQNGQFNLTVRTDAAGVASATFTAFAQGITCWITASAGAQARFFVVTYVPAFTTLSAAVPATYKPGEPFSFGAALKYGQLALFNVDIAARIVPGAGNADISPGSGDTGQGGSTNFTVTPSSVGDFQVELATGGKVQRFPVALAASPWQDMWWSGYAENGWGMSVVQHRDVLFAVIYAYDAAGAPTWYVMPGGAWNAAHTAFTGALYLPHGAPYTAYDTGRFDIGAPIGNATIDVSDATHVRLDYSIRGMIGHKSLERQLFGTVDSGAAPQVGDMWWGGLQQNGWGIALLQQYRSLFGVWFTYDASGAATWFVMPAGSWSDAQTWEGRMYRANGSPWLGGTYDPSALRMTDVGAFRFRFTGDAAAFDYAIDGKAGNAALVRQAF